MSTPIQNSQQQLNSFTTEIPLRDLLDSYRDLTSISINCHHIGTIQSFDATKQTANATVNYTKTFFQWNPQINATTPVQINYPILMMCPVICLGGGTAALTFPIRPGDECLVLFNDRSLDNWFQSGTVGPVNSPRLHSISDGIILVGLRNSQKVISSYDTTRAVLRNNQAEVGVGPTLIKIANNTTTLNTLLQSLITQIAAITVTGVTTGGGTSGPPANAAAINAIATQLSGLLE